jgi:hypothetical protein
MLPSAFLQATLCISNKESAIAAQQLQSSTTESHHQNHHLQRRRCKEKALATATGRFEWFAGAVAVAKISTFFTLI